MDTNWKVDLEHWLAPFLDVLRHKVWALICRPSDRPSSTSSHDRRHKVVLMCSVKDSDRLISSFRPSIPQDEAHAVQ